MSGLVRWLLRRGGLVFIAVVAMCVGAFYRDYVGLKRGKYTIGYVTGRTVLPSSGWSVQYRFAVNDAVYTGSAPDVSGMNRADGARYLLKYDSLAPDTHQIFYEDPIPDSIARAPRNGWRWRPWPNPDHPELSAPPPPLRPARDSTEAALWRELDATQAGAESLKARQRR